MGKESTIRSLVLGVVLAGGQARRMGPDAKGGDKTLLDLAGRPLLAHVIERLTPQVDALIISANGNPARFADFGLPVIADAAGEHSGPLAGLLAAFDWAAVQETAFDAVVTVPGDSPFLPLNLVARLYDAGRGRAAIAVSKGRDHPVFGLFPLTLAGDLRAFLDGGDRKAGAWTTRVGAVSVPFEGDPIDPFFNINAPEDMALAAQLAKDQGLT